MDAREKTVLSFSRDPAALAIREWSLRKGGFEVISVGSEAEARLEIEMGRCGVFLLCTETELIKLFRRNCPSGRIVLVRTATSGAAPRGKIAERARNVFKRFGYGQEGYPTEQIADDEAVADVLNTASKHELMSVDGIGKGTANRIINNRPYETSTEVVQVGVLPEEMLDRVKEQLLDKPA
jgi:hypothetical protein